MATPGNPVPDPIPLYVPFTSPNQILNFSKNLTFRVFYLEAPLSILSETLLDSNLINNIGQLNIFHSGLGFQCTSERQPFEFTFDYNLINGFNATTLLPTIQDDDLIWNNEATVYLGNYIDRDYWNHSSYIGDITADQLITIQRWILNVWNPENPIYVLFSGVESSSRQNLFNPIMRSSTCFDFAYQLIDFMKNNLRVCIDYPTVPNLTISTFISSFPGSIEPVDFNENRNEIIAFYEEVITFINDNVNIPSDIQQCIEEDGCSLNVYAIENDLFTIIQLYEEIYNNFPIVYQYGYLPDGNLGYWKITQPNPFVSYIKINIKRSYRALDIEGTAVTDAYSDIIVTCIFRSDSNFTFIFWFVIFIIFLIIIFIIIFYVFLRKNKKII